MRWRERKQVVLLSYSVNPGDPTDGGRGSKELLYATLLTLKIHDMKREEARIRAQKWVAGQTGASYIHSIQQKYVISLQIDESFQNLID